MIMGNKSIPPFYVGQEVVALRSWGLDGYNVIKNKNYTVTQVRLLCCGWAISVGVKPDPLAAPYQVCQRCHSQHYVTDELFYAAKIFAPITSTFQSITLEKVLEKETKLIGAN